jgi:putative glycosyltransferase
MKLSIVSTLYQSAIHIDEFYRRITAAARLEAGNDYEIIRVNDGSPDNSITFASAIQAKDSHVVVIDLARNFGHHKAIMTGLGYAKGERIFLIDSDLEEEPELLPCFSEKMSNEQCDSVFGVQKSRRGGRFERFSGWLFFVLFNFLTGYDFPKNTVTARLMNRRFLDALLLHRERELSIGGIFFITGFEQRPLTIIKHSSSESTYTLLKKVSLFVNSIASFSSKPLVGIFFLGLVVFTLSLVVSVYFILKALLFANPPSGWTSLMISVWALGGIIISCIGVVGIYISKIYEESKQRPYTIVKHIYESPLENNVQLLQTPNKMDHL